MPLFDLALRLLTDAVEKGFQGESPSNIDSKQAPKAQVRFKESAPTIRLLRFPIPQFFRGDFFNSIDPKKT
jgi:hypothetical protein